MNKMNIKNMNMNKLGLFKKRGGFTIIETLVAITILMIAIAGPLSIASKGLTSALTSKDQMIASYLAQESMEVIKNIRNSNINSGSSWLAGLVGCTDSSRCDAGSADSAQVSTCSSGACPIYSGTGGYGHDSVSRTQTIFTRYFKLTDAGGTGDCAVNSEECMATVAVNWSEGLVPYDVILSSQITNALR